MGHYFERILSKKEELKEVPKVQDLLTCLSGAEENPALKELLGGIYPEMIALLGQRTGELHLSLYSIKGDPEFSPEPFSQHYQRSIFQSMRSTVRQAFSLLRKAAGKLPEELKSQASEALKSEDRIIQRFSRVMSKKISAMKIRIHGDFHLGQVLYTGKDFMIIDFEGEPARALGERRLRRSPLRDVAGMIRSFHYAAYAALLKYPGLRPEDRAYLEPWIEALYHYLGGIFLCSYLKTVGKAAFLPTDPEEFKILFESFLLEKAVYELGYELNNRPDWVVIPLKGINYILKGEA
jgi:maltose alpha-D-glucosyltransferase/alpha-amylase